MDFRKYNSIENTYREKFIDKIRFQDTLKDREYFITEKVHGGNCVLCADNTGFYLGRRTGLLEGDELFYNANDMLMKYSKKVEALLYYLEAKTIFIYGELFGGYYPHENVERSKTACKVQKGVYYHPENKFLAFDIIVDDKYLNLPQFIEACEKFDIPYIPVLFKGNLDECLKYPNEFQTTIPDLFDLPVIENNICEGVVIKPCEPWFVGESRVILKNKNELFSEKEHVHKEKIIIELSEAAQGCLNRLLKYASENRLNSVVSKIGEVTLKDFGKVLGDFNQDILSEFELDEEYEKDSTWFELSKDESKRVKKHLNGVTANLIKEWMYKNV